MSHLFLFEWGVFFTSNFFCPLTEKEFYFRKSLLFISLLQLVIISNFLEFFILVLALRSPETNFPAQV